MEVYKDHEWLPWMFEHATRGFWDDKQNQVVFVDWLGKCSKYFVILVGKKLGIKSMEDWYKLQQKDLIQNGGSTLLKQHGHSVYKFLCNMFPVS